MTNKTFGVLIVMGVFLLFILIRYVNTVKKLKEENGRMKGALDGLQEQNSRLSFEVQWLKEGGKKRPGWPDTSR